MVDIARKVIVRDVDIRAFIVLTVSILLSEFTGAYETMGMIIIGILWAFSTEPLTESLVNNFINNFESQITPIKEDDRWEKYGRPLAYLLFILFITVLALI